MTAIFMVWNSKGLAIAADQSVTLSKTDENGNEQVVHSENESKLYKNDNFNFVVGSAGKEAINGVPINGILGQWFKNCGRELSLAAYVSNFMKWYSQEAALDQASNTYTVSIGRMEGILRALKEDFETEEDETKRTFDFRVQIIKENEELWRQDDFINSVGLTEKLNHSTSMENKPVANELIYLFQKHEYSEEVKTDFAEQLHHVFLTAFINIFGQEYDPSVDWQSYLCDFAKRYLIEFADSKWSSADLMFVGYGDTDWNPTCIVVKLYNFDFVVPWLVCENAYNRSEIWYQTLGQDAAVSKFWAPMDGRVRTELLDSLDANFEENPAIGEIKNQIHEVLNRHERDLLDPILEKVNVLSVRKLSFIAKQMVALESFRSFIHEYLPTVGGEIDCITLTRDDSEATRV